MESHIFNRVSAVIAGLAILATQAVAVAQEQPPPDVNKRRWVAVHTEDRGAVVEAESRETTQGTKAAPQAAKAAPQASKRKKRGSSNCRLTPDTANISEANSHIYAQAAERGETSYSLYCNGEWKGLVWRKTNQPRPQAPARPATSPNEVALNLRQEIPMPEAVIRMNPGIGMAGAESWFWIDGYSGQPLTHSTDALGQPVEVQASVERYEWSFGDGRKIISSSPGKPYPERSDVLHIYEQASKEGFPVKVSFLFSVSYRTGGSEWSPLPGVVRTTEARYPVRETQAVIRR